MCNDDKEVLDDDLKLIECEFCDKCGADLPPGHVLREKSFDKECK